MFLGSLQSGLLLFFSLLFGSISLAEETDGNRLNFVNREVDANTNIHFNKYYCLECHLETKEHAPGALRFDNYSETCRCHNYTPETYTHPVGIKVSPQKRAKIPPDFPLQDDTITCATCHIMSLQCRADSNMRKFNRAFLRVLPHPSRTAICYKCHDEEKYKMFNPHNQLDGDGNIVKEKCLYCHKQPPDVKQATAIAPEEIGELVAPIGKLDVLCYRCHYNKLKLHPINADHLKKPSDRILGNIRRSERRLRITMPLNAQGDITCVTCHNPHERGVIPADKTGAGGAGEAGRLRVPRGGDKICMACHLSS